MMAKSQKKSNKEVRKPKAEKAKKSPAGLAAKPGVVAGLDNIKK